jgi:predicted nucleic acid-binding protein
MRIAIDAVTLLHVVERELTCTHPLVAPSFIRSEALELLLVARRSDADARELHCRMTELKLRLLGDRVSRWTAWEIARERGWDRLRDAEYLAIAKLQADAFVTIDRKLAKRAVAIVPVVALDAVFRTSARAAARPSRRTRDRRPR